MMRFDLGIVKSEGKVMMVVVTQERRVAHEEALRDEFGRSVLKSSLWELAERLR